MKRYRHSPEEIAEKIRQADEMAREGKSQPEIARALGVSIMTIHRWRKSPPSADRRSHALMRGRVEEKADLGQARRIEELELENSRLRRLVADFLLEKMRLEDEILSRNTR